MNELLGLIVFVLAVAIARGVVRWLPWRQVESVYLT